MIYRAVGSSGKEEVILPRDQLDEIVSPPTPLPSALAIPPPPYRNEEVGMRRELIAPAFMCPSHVLSERYIPKGRTLQRPNSIYASTSASARWSGQVVLRFSSSCQPPFVGSQHGNLHQSLVSQLVGALSPVTHRGLHQGYSGLCMIRSEGGPMQLTGR